ncbi:coiled-coil domain-containing protein 171 isoform X2 [Antennarius striatus]|uniref:coiled-coil domain-containing protein 171 isoform X2 n=1 Tax=Antennarius striatus TaxID=241820 RepID=UPI0035B08299
MAGERGRRVEREDRGKEERDRKTNQGDEKKWKEREGRSRRVASEGSETSERLRWRVQKLEKEKLELMSNYNQELCRLQVELTRLRSLVERGEAQREELAYELTVSRRDADQASELCRDKQVLTEQTAELQTSVQKLQKALVIIQRAREEDQHALQQELEERDRQIQNFSSETQRLHRLLQSKEASLKESERRILEVQKEREKEAEATREQGCKLKSLMEKEEKNLREKEVSDQRVKSLEASVEATRAAHLESKFNSEVIQLQVKDLEAALAAERSNQQEAQSSLELLRAQFREVERAYILERERSCSTERTLELLQNGFEQHKSELSIALETERKVNFDLTERLEEENRRHADLQMLLEQAVGRQRDAEEAFVSCVKGFRETLHQHNTAGVTSQAEDDGSPTKVLQLLKATLSTFQQRLETTNKQVQDLLLAAERLHKDNQTLEQLTSDQSRQMEELQQELIKLEEEGTLLRQESSDWSTRSRGLQAEMEAERKERMAEVQKITEDYQEESKVRLSFLYSIYQRLLTGCVPLDQSQSIVGNFTWSELCDVINEHVDHMISDHQKANDRITHLTSVCEKKNVCLHKLQRSQERVLSRLEESARRREEAWTRQHTHTVTQLQKELQVYRSQCDSLHDEVSSMKLHSSSLTSDLSHLQDLLSKARRESASFLSACSLLSGALKHSHRHRLTLCKQKALLSRQLAEKEVLEEEVRRLAGALGGEKGEEEEKGGKGRAVRRWRRSVCVVLAVRRLRELARETTVLFRLEMKDDRPAVRVCGGLYTATQKGQDKLCTDDKSDGKGCHDVCAHWLHSKCLSSIILSSMTELQGTLTQTGSSPSDMMSASHALSRLLDHLLDHSEVTSSLSHSGLDEDTLASRLRRGLNRLMPPQASTKAVVSTLQQHFLLFSQRLHSAEVERRSLRLEVANLKRELQQTREETCRTVPSERFHSVCEELHQALSREQEAQILIQEQSKELHTLQLRVNTHTTEQMDTQHTLIQIRKSLTEARQEVSRKERSLRILGKHLSGVQKERKQLEERSEQLQVELRDATSCKDFLISNMRAAEMSYKQVRETLIQSHCTISALPRPLPLPKEHLKLIGAESIMGAPEMAACQSLLFTFSQLYQTCCSRFDWLEQEVSALRCHVTTLRKELQDVCLRDNLINVAEHPETFLSLETLKADTLPDLFQEPPLSISPDPTQSPLTKSSQAKKKEKKTARKKRGEKR